MDGKQYGKIVTVVRVLVSLAVLGAALFVILSQRYPEDYAKWAFGVIGVVIGYWLR